MLDLDNNFNCEETEDNVHFHPKKRNKNGFMLHVSFTKDKDKHEDAIEAIKEYFIREVF